MELVKKVLLFVSLLSVQYSFSQELGFSVLENQAYNPLKNRSVVSPSYAWAYFEELVEDFGFIADSPSGEKLSQIGFSEGQIDMLSNDFNVDLSLVFLTGYAKRDKNYDESKTVSENSQIEGQSTVAYAVEMESTEEVLKMEWRNIKFSNSSEGDSICIQVWLYKSGIIEYRYGPRSIANPGAYNRVDVSLYEENNAGTDFYYSLKGSPDSPELVKNPGSEGVFLSALPAAGTVYRFEKSTVGLNKYDKEKVAVYPNPSNDGVFHIKGRDIGAAWQVYNPLGGLTLYGKGPIVDLSGLEKGVYLLRSSTINLKLIRN